MTDIKDLKDSFWRRVQTTLGLRAFGFFKIALIGFLRPRVLCLRPEKVEIVIPLGRRSRNHLKSMYFGALTTGADLSCGLLAFELIYTKYPKIQFVFKDIKGSFLKRAEGDVHFLCYDGPAIIDLMEKANTTGERFDLLTTVKAVCPSIDPDESVAEFELTISVKRRS